MLHAVRQFLTGSEPMEFESDYGLDESVLRLRDATRRWALFSSTEVAAGTVTASRVSLQRVIPMVGNSFKPFFVGKFERRADKVVLIGRFTMHIFVKVFMGVWMAFVAFITLVGGVAATQSHRAVPMPFVGLGMLLFAVLLICFGAWLSRNDPVWLSQVISRALSSPGAVSDAMASSPARSQVRSTGWARFTTKAAAALTLLGVMVSISAITGVQSYRAGPGGSVITHYPDVTSRYLSGMFGMAMLGLAYGIYRRRVLAWRLVFVIIGGAWVSQLAMFFVGGIPPAPTFALVLFGAVSALVMIVWGRWWYAQRVHFREE
ncbi:hypothetical protein [Dyella nitratireducens]|uniref:Uncharacterized protein n=1 Tax=Dyella nitratireducens TaxID=1849580 RepID=A0ABQ1GLN9_9GAMM|nr:hypothetical protein [Dyella nitratireducens]GGA46063.1 hypothetical protein GCM10010981_39000 [Dyella nitratireducens]GLQ41401.1 hypothetical protein GCM10007902_12510 [Dyella nitratireducens]